MRVRNLNAERCRKKYSDHPYTFFSHWKEVATCIVVILVLSQILIRDSHASPLKKGDVLPHSEFSGAFGGAISSESLQGRFIYLDFWASWCPPCRLSLPFMNSLYDEFDSKNLTILAVSVDDEEEAMLSAIKRIQPHYTVLRDKDKSFIGKIDPPKMPTSYLINPEGEVLFVHEGFVSGDELLVAKKIREILQGQAN